MKKYIIRLILISVLIFIILSFPVFNYKIPIFAYLKKVNTVITSNISDVDNDVYEILVIKPRGKTRLIHVIYAYFFNRDELFKSHINEWEPGDDNGDLNIYFTDTYEQYKNGSIENIYNDLDATNFTIPIYNAYKNKLDDININYEGFITISGSYIYPDDVETFNESPPFARFKEINGININNRDDFNTKILANLQTGDKVLLKTIKGEEFEIFPIFNEEELYLPFDPFFIYTVDKNQFRIKESIFRSGTSGQLMQSISLYLEANSLTLKDGIKIAGTGSLNFDGFTIPINDIRTKLKAAAKKKIDYFFLPTDNYQSAKKYITEEGLKITLVPIDYFEEATNMIINNLI